MSQIAKAGTINHCQPSISRSPSFSALSAPASPLGTTLHVSHKAQKAQWPGCESDITCTSSNPTSDFSLDDDRSCSFYIDLTDAK